MRIINTICLIFAISFALNGQVEYKLHKHSNGQRCATHVLHDQKIKDNPEYRRNFESSSRVVNNIVSSGVKYRTVDEVVTIPVVFHVVHNGEVEGTGANISEEYLLAQLEQLNLDFRGANPDISNVPEEFKSLVADTKIEFCLAKRTPDNQSTTGILRHNYNQSSYSVDDFETTIKPATIWDRDSYLNIWVATIGEGLLGYAQFPGDAAETDGVVVLNSSVGSVDTPNPNGSPYNLGRTLTHEVGHWIFLYHIWGDANGGGCTGDDEVEDTPMQETSNNGVPVYPVVSCNSNDMFMNFMDYVNDDTMHMFSLGQKLRTDAALAGPRASLLDSQGCKELNGVGLSTPEKSLDVCPNEPVSFTVNVDYLGTFSGDVTIAQSGLDDTLVTLSQTNYSESGQLIVDIDTSSLVPGEYSTTINANDGVETQKITLSFSILSPLVEVPTLTIPANGSAVDGVLPVLEWNAVPNAVSYSIEVATDDQFADVMLSGTSTTPYYVINTFLDVNTTYYWRVTAVSQCNTITSGLSSFTTGALENCADFMFDGGFEAGVSPNDNWLESSTKSRSLIASGVGEDGSIGGLLGVEDGEISILVQGVQVPTDASLAKFTYSYKITSEDLCGYDTGGVAIFTPEGDLLAFAKEYDLCANNASTVFLQDEVDLSEYKGQVLAVGFYVINDSYAPSTLTVDNASLAICKDAIMDIPSDDKEYVADYEVVDGQWVHYIDDNGTPFNYLDDWRLLSVDDNGNNLGSIGDEGFKVVVKSNPTSSTIESGELAGTTMFNRHWELIPTTQPTSDVRVVQYFTDADLKGMKIALNLETLDVANLGAWKINDNPTIWDYNPANGMATVPKVDNYKGDGFWAYNPGNVASSTVVKYDKIENHHSLSYVVGHFGGGGATYSTEVNTLPVEFGKFDVQASYNDALLSWTTLSEINNSHFVIERSTDGYAFDEVGEVSGNGNSTSELSYRFKDTGVESAIAYYRLKQVDYDGNFAYSETKVVAFNEVTNTLIFPNPAKVNAGIMVKSNLDISTISIFNTLGKEVLKTTYNNVNTVSVSTNGLQSGVYYMIINNSETHRVVIQ